MGKRHYNCLARFMQKDEMFFDNIREFLIDERLIKKEELTNVDRPEERVKYLLNTLNRIQKDELVMLVDWEWMLLPVERLKITIVTDNLQKEFTYGH